jgi:hypothetical protein
MCWAKKVTWCRMNACSRCSGPAPDALEAPLLDLVEQVLLAAHVVVHSGQTHPARPGQVAHRGALVALIGKDPGSDSQQRLATAVELLHKHSLLFEQLFEWQYRRRLT